MSRMTDAGSWLLAKLGRGANAEVVAGDLMEALAAGRSAGWYWQQVICAVGLAWVMRVRANAAALAFSLAWSSLLWSPLVQVYWSGPMQSMSEWLLNPTWGVMRRAWSLPWPYSMIVDLGLSQMIDCIFVWLGMLVYLVVSRKCRQGNSKTRVLGGCVFSFGVYLAGRAAIMAVTYTSPMGRMAFGRVHADAISLWISFLLALSLFCGIVLARPQHAKAIEARP